MKCEICHSAEAERAIMKKAKGQPDQELYVCAGCAIEAKLAEHDEELGSLKKTAEKLAKKPPAPPQEPDALPELVGMIIDATLEIINHALPSQEPACPQCGVTRTEYRKASRLGCAVCYETFAKELTGLIADMHRTPKHDGKAPKKPVPSKEVQKLMRQLSAAERARRMEDADTLRAAIRSLGWRPDAPGGDAG
ncbi:MAG: hypothetical protein FWG50_08810 [Kiritimatiellaeota bacterium]|nr:hypothetical protein [Kiritimatiellota bacterium]